MALTRLTNAGKNATIIKGKKKGGSAKSPTLKKSQKNRKKTNDTSGRGAQSERKIGIERLET